jgi:predicted transcriptional regulator
MEMNDYIVNDFTPFDLETTIREVRQFFGNTAFSHAPVVEGKVLVGLFPREEAEVLADDDRPLGAFQQLFTYYGIGNVQNIMDLIKVFAANETNLVPVIGEKQVYLGYLELMDVLHLLNSAPFFDHEGESILLEKDVKSYSFSQISQIVETNKGRILCSFIADIDENKVRISLKFQAPEINEVLQTFRRYEYDILSDHKEDFYLEDLKSRSEYLQKYLNI